MSADDDLRDSLHDELTLHAIECTGPGEVTCTCRNGGWMSWSAHKRHVIDALLPVIRAHLADAWQHGFRAVAPHTPDEQIATRNPWEQED